MKRYTFLPDPHRLAEMVESADGEWLRHGEVLKVDDAMVATARKAALDLTMGNDSGWLNLTEDRCESVIRWMLRRVLFEAQESSCG